MPNLTREEREQRLQEVRKQAMLLDGLRSQPAWQVILDAIQEKQAKMLRQLTRPGEASVRQFDFNRGFLAGCQWIARIPEEAVASVEQAERRARLMTEEDDQSG